MDFQQIFSLFIFIGRISKYFEVDFLVLMVQKSWKLMEWRIAFENEFQNTIIGIRVWKNIYASVCHSFCVACVCVNGGDCESSFLLRSFQKPTVPVFLSIRFPLKYLLTYLVWTTLCNQLHLYFVCNSPIKRTNYSGTHAYPLKKREKDENWMLFVLQTNGRVRGRFFISCLRFTFRDTIYALF